jgi:DNA replication protein DnaC
MRSPRPRSPKAPPSCSLGICDGSGFEIDEQTNTARDCACRAQRVANARASHLRGRVPRRYMDLSWDRPPLTTLANDPLTADSVRKVKRYCADIPRNLADGRGLWLMGHTGTGKTTLGYTIAATAAQAGHSVLSFNAVALLNRLRDTLATDNAERLSDVIGTLAEVELLHIEDLRVVRPTDWVLEQLYLIVNARYEEQRAIVFTSDIDSDADGPLDPDVDELANRIGWRTLSRLLEICGDPTMILGKDNRLDYDVPGTGPAPENQPWDRPAPDPDPDPHHSEASAFTGPSPALTLL